MFVCMHVSKPNLTFQKINWIRPEFLSLTWEKDT